MDIFYVHCAYSCKVKASTDKNCGSESKNKFKTQYFHFFNDFSLFFQISVKTTEFKRVIQKVLHISFNV